LILAILTGVSKTFIKDFFFFFAEMIFITQ
jgi:hypothetical protein